MALAYEVGPEDPPTVCVDTRSGLKTLLRGVLFFEVGPLKGPSYEEVVGPEDPPAVSLSISWPTYSGECEFRAIRL